MDDGIKEDSNVWQKQWEEQSALDVQRVEDCARKQMRSPMLSEHHHLEEVGEAHTEVEVWISEHNSFKS